MSTKRSFSQLLSIIIALSGDNNINNTDIKWLRKEMKTWWCGLFKF